MCLMFAMPDGQRVNRAALEKAWNLNHDGAGFMYASKGRVVIHKGFFTFEDFWKAYVQHLVKGRGRKGAAVVHFRFATHGLKDKVNCHPHRINDRLAFAHNGIIRIDTPNPARSDTLEFRDRYLSDLPDGWLENQAICDLVGARAAGSKLAFIDGRGRLTIINEHLGAWRDNVWISSTIFGLSAADEEEEWDEDDDHADGDNDGQRGEARGLFERTA
jgi:hypothetical protein